MATTFDPPRPPRPGEDEEEHPPARPLSFTEAQEVVGTAHALQEEAERRAESERRLREMAGAAAEVGLDPEHLPMAERLVRVRAEERARREVEGRRRRLFLVGGVALAFTTALAAGGWFALAPEAPTTSSERAAPWTDPLAPDTWTLDVSAGSSASVSWPVEAGRGTVGEVKVDRFVPAADGRYWANLDSRAHRDWTGMTELSVDLRGEGLQNARVYLERPDERWRGPNVPVSETWTSHTLRLDQFERQERRNGEWRVVRWEPPVIVDTVSVKVGWYVNDADAVGTLQVDDLSAR